MSAYGVGLGWRLVFTSAEKAGSQTQNKSKQWAPNPHQKESLRHLVDMTSNCRPFPGEKPAA